MVKKAQGVMLLFRGWGSFITDGYGYYGLRNQFITGEQQLTAQLNEKAYN